MPTSNDNGLSARLRRLPGQLFLALLNGTAVLVIIASVLALIASAKITHLAHDVTSTMTDAVLSRVDVKPRQFLAALEGVSTDVHALMTELKQQGPDTVASLDPAIERLNEKLTTLETNVERLADARSTLMDEAVARLSLSLGETLQRFGNCKADSAKP